MGFGCEEGQNTASLFLLNGKDGIYKYVYNFLQEKKKTLNISFPFLKFFLLIRIFGPRFSIRGENCAVKICLGSVFMPYR